MGEVKTATYKCILSEDEERMWPYGELKNVIGKAKDEGKQFF